MAIVTAASNTSSFTPEPNPDSKTAPIQKATPAPETKASTEATRQTPQPKPVGAGQLQIPVGAIDRQADVLSDQYIQRFQNTLLAKTQEKMAELFETWMPEFDQQIADTIDAVTTQVESSYSLPSRNQRSLGSAD